MGTTRNNLMEILSLDANDKKYEAVDIETVIIDGNPFTNYGDFQFIYEKSYVKEPTRSGNGSIGNLNSYSTFLTPHLIMNFSIMSIDDYRKIMQIHYNSNEHMVECYDPIYNRKIKVKMYFATEQIAKLHTISRKRFANGEWEEWVDLVGVREYSVELIGTNNELDTLNVIYKYNAPVDNSGKPIYPTGIPVPDQYEEDTYQGEEISIGSNCTFIDTPPSSLYKFKQWVDNERTIYPNGKIITLNESLILYAEWETTKTYTLSYNYGLSSPITDTDSITGQIIEITDKDVEYNKSIGTLPIPITPYVELNGTKYYPYTNGAWYKHPINDAEFKVEDNDSYWLRRSTVIYYLFDIKSYEVNYVTNNEYNFPSQAIQYGGVVYLPTITKKGYTFDGWYIDSQFKTKFSGKMPPYNITLYAKWVTT